MCILGVVYVFHMCWPWAGSSACWMDGLIQVLGFGWVRVVVSKHVWVFPLANFVVVGGVVIMSCVVYVFPMCWHLGWVKCWLDGWVESVFGVWLGQRCGLNKVEAFALQAPLGFGLVVFMHGFVHVFPLCWPWVLSSVGWVYGLILCLGWGWSRAGVKHIVLCCLWPLLWFGSTDGTYGVFCFLLLMGVLEV